MLINTELFFVLYILYYNLYVNQQPYISISRAVTVNAFLEHATHTELIYTRRVTTENSGVAVAPQTTDAFLPSRERVFNVLV